MMRASQVSRFSLCDMFCAALVAATIFAAKPAAANICYNNGCSINLYGHVNLVNNWFGQAKTGAQGSQSVWTNPGQSNSAGGSNLTWNAGNNQYGVKSYCGAYDGWDYSSGFNGAPFPKQISSGSAANNQVNGYFASNGSQDSIWDSFYNYNKSPGAVDPNMEIEVYITASFSYGGTPAYQTTLKDLDGNNQTYNVYGPGNGGWPIWTFVPSYRNYEHFNLMQLAQDLVNHGKVSSSLYMLDDNFGEECYYTNGNTSFGWTYLSEP